MNPSNNVARWLASALLAVAACCAHAAPYPERPITLIVPFPAGGGTDLSARLIAPYIEKNLPGARIVILNRPGAGGDIGALEMARAKPDGYTIGFMNVPNTMMKSHERATQWNVNSFVPIANLVFDPAVLATSAEGRYRTLADVVNDAKKRPGALTVASAGAGSNTHLDFINFQAAANVKMLHVPFEGGAATRTALLGGHVDLMASALGDVQRFVESGKIRALAIGTKTRHPLAPAMPTFTEQGYPVVGGSSRGLVGPKGMPQEAVDALAKATELALKDPELIKKANDIALPLEFMGPAEYGNYLRVSDRELADVWKRSPWTE